MRSEAMTVLMLVCATGAGCSRRQEPEKAVPAAASPPPSAASAATPAPSASASASLTPKQFFAQDPLGPQLEAAPSTGATNPVHVTFDWSPPCRVPALYVVTRQGHTARMRMIVSLGPAAEGFTLALRDMTLLRLDALDATRPDVARALAPTAALMTNMPTARISPAGAFLGARDMDAYATKLATSLAGSPIPELRRVAPMARAPEVQKLMEEDLRALWSSWVETWLAVSLAPGAETITTLPAVAGGRTKSATVLIQNRGAVREAPQLSLLSVHEAIADPKGEALSVVALDAAHDRPYHARYEVRDDGADAGPAEVHETAFDWAHAVGCGR